MKSYLFVCLFAAAVMAARGTKHMYMFNDDILGTLDKMQDPADPVARTPPPPTSPTESPTEPPTYAPTKGQGEEKPNPHDCDCKDECHNLHNDRLPKDIQDEHKYLSYENFPVLCRDASAIMLPSGAKIQKKYVCKQVFDCCRTCNQMFYKCVGTKPNTYGFCMRGAYKCMCDCIEKKSYKELPYSHQSYLPQPPQPQTQAPPEGPPTPTP